MASSAVVFYQMAALKKSRVDKRKIAARKRMQARRKGIIFLSTYSVLILCANYLLPNPRSVWMHKRSSHWWANVVLNNFRPHDWMENFRMSKSTFMYVCDQLRPLIQKQNTRMRKPVSTECRVAITLWILATSAEYRSVAHLFGLAHCIVCKIVNENCRAITKKLLLFTFSFPLL